MSRRFSFLAPLILLASAFTQTIVGPLAIQNPAPSGLSASYSPTGGSLAPSASGALTRCYAVTGIDASGNESALSAEQCVTQKNVATGQVVLSWNAPSVYSSYRIHRGFSSGSYGGYMTSSSSPFTDDGTKTVTLESGVPGKGNSFAVKIDTSGFSCASGVNCGTASGSPNQVMATPNGSSGAAALRAIVTSDLPSIAESKLSITDVTTGNVSTSAHGFAPKGDGNASHYLDGTGAYSAGGGFTPPVVATQSANGATLEKFKRFTDTSPTGFFDLFRDAADANTLFSVDVSGNVLGAGTVTASGFTATGAGPWVGTTINGPVVPPGVANQFNLIVDRVSGNIGCMVGTASSNVDCSPPALFPTRRYGSVMPTNGSAGSTLQYLGEVQNNEVGNSTAGVGPSAGVGEAKSYTSAATTNSEAGGNANATHHTANDLDYRFKFQLGTTSNVRLIIGFAANSAVRAQASTFNANATFGAAVRYDSGAGDSKFQCLNNASGSADTVTATSISPDTAVHTGRIKMAGNPPTSVTFYLDGVQVCQLASNLPNGVVGMMWSTATLANAAETFTFYGLTTSDNQ